MKIQTGLTTIWRIHSICALSLNPNPRRNNSTRQTESGGMSNDDFNYVSRQKDYDQYLTSDYSKNGDSLIDPYNNRLNTVDDRYLDSITYRIDSRGDSQRRMQNPQGERRCDDSDSRHNHALQGMV